METIRRILNGQQQDNIAPFLWIHGEEPEVMIEEIRHIYDSGIRSLCVEARPHRDFNGPEWFEDLKTILDECRRLGMKMWLLDDSHFPTGYVNGEVKKNYPHLCKQFLFMRTMDFVGPMPNAAAVLKHLYRTPEDQLLGVTISRKTEYEVIDPDTTVDLSGSLREISDYYTGKPRIDWMGRQIDGIEKAAQIVEFDLPEGEWSVNALFVSYKGGEKETEGYLNPVLPEATDILLEKVYQPVYDRFHEDFGKTFQGFFTDEPRFGNIHGSENASIGRNSAMDLPWSDRMLSQLLEHCNKTGGILAGMTQDQLVRNLPLLFISSTENGEEFMHALRYAYMDLVSDLYSKNFDGRIAEWCHAHNCRHIGHTVEDMGGASRLGYGAGHIFRAMKHADMAGIDVVLHQLLPGQDSGFYKGTHSTGWNGRYASYMLGKFGGSLAHLDEKKNGRCMCELFGAYGWAEGNRLGKWMADHMLVRGVNYLVPHAFNCAPFPDVDCPPHFYAQGKNPQYPEFKMLMNYCNRLCTLLSNGRNITPAALYFNAEGEWSGDYMETEIPAAILAKNQIDYDLVTADYLKLSEVKEGELHINTERFRALILPWAQALPQAMLEKVLEAAQQGVRVYFLNGLPERSSENADSQVLEKLAEIKTVRIVSTDELVNALRQDQINEIQISEYLPGLHYYHYRQEESDIYFFVNEEPYRRAVCNVEGHVTGNIYEYDPFSNTLYKAPDAFSLDIPAYGSKVVIVSREEIPEAQEQKKTPAAGKAIELLECDVLLAEKDTLKDGSAVIYEQQLHMDRPAYISTLPEFGAFAGRILYRFHINFEEKSVPAEAYICLEGVRESAAVRINGTDCGTKIVPDYRFEAAGMKAGDNLIEIELNTTLARAVNDAVSTFMILEPSGMNGAKLVVCK